MLCKPSFALAAWLTLTSVVGFPALRAQPASPGEFLAGSSIVLSPSPVHYTVADWPVLLDDAGSLRGCSDGFLPGAVLKIAITSQASPLDSLTLEPQPGSSISVETNAVDFGGTVVGVSSGGDGATPLVINLNRNATSAAVTALIRAVTFSTQEESTTRREIQFTLTSGSVVASASRVVVLNHPPKASDYTLMAQEGAVVNIPFSALLASATDPDNDPITVTDVGLISRAGGRISTSSKGLTYTPPAKALKEDSFAYAVQDNHQGTGVGVVTIVFVKPVNLAITGDSLIWSSNSGL